MYLILWALVAFNIALTLLLAVREFVSRKMAKALNESFERAKRD